MHGAEREGRYSSSERKFDDSGPLPGRAVKG